MSFSIFFFFFLVLANPTHQASVLVTKTCDGLTLYKDTCNSALGSASGTDIKDVHSLAKFALKMTSSNGVEIQNRISELLKTNSDGPIQQCLTDCSNMYQGAMDRLKDSMAAMDSKAFNDVSTWVSAVMTDAQSCEGGFKEKPGTVSPLTDLNKKFSQLCSVSLAITNLAKN